MVKEHVAHRHEVRLGGLLPVLDARPRLLPRIELSGRLRRQTCGAATAAQGGLLKTGRAKRGERCQRAHRGHDMARIQAAGLSTHADRHGSSEQTDRHGPPPTAPIPSQRWGVREGEPVLRPGQSLFLFSLDGDRLEAAGKKGLYSRPLRVGCCVVSHPPAPWR